MVTATAKTRRTRYSVADRIDEAAVTELLRLALAGGQPLPAEAAGGRSVLWRDLGDEVLVHLDSVAVRLVPRFAFVSVELESEQTGRAPLIVTLAMGSTQDGAGLFAATDDLPRGHPLLAARWGAVLRQTVWSALLGLATQHADERGKVPLSMHVLEGRLRFGAEKPLALQEHAQRSFDLTFPGRRAALRGARK